MKTKKEIFAEVTATTEWATVDEIINKLDRAGYWDKDFRDRALLDRKKAEVRKQIKGLKNSDNKPLFYDILTTDENGEERHVYKQETLFDLGDYEQTISYNVTTGQHYIDIAVYLRGRALARFHVQLPLQFEIPDIAKGAA